METGLVLLIIVVAFVVWVGFVAARSSIRSYREVEARPEVMKAVAQRLGFTHRPVDPEGEVSLVERTVFLAEFGPPSLRLQGALDGQRVEVLETTVRRGGRVARYSTQLGFLFEVPAPGWQRFVLQLGAWESDPGDLDDAMKGCAQVDLADDAFEAAFTLCLYPGEDVRWRFPPQLRARLVAEQQAGRAFTVESLGPVVLAWRAEPTLAAELVPQRLAEARAFVALVGQGLAERR